MLDQIQLENILFVDVETVPMAASYDDIPEELQQQWNKKAARISTDESITPEELFFERAGIYSEFGKIVCISAGFFYKNDDELKFRVKAFYSNDEKELLSSFAELLNQKYNTKNNYLCGHNSREFDFPYIARRMLINGIKLPEILNVPGRKPWEVSFLDTMDLWKFGDYKNYTSLALLAAVFNIPTPKDDIAGNDVARVYWQEQNLERIAVYCNKDVVTTARLYLKYSLRGDLPDENIETLV
jgi:DNA polymerase elongation subunit (family B)